MLISRKPTLNSIGAYREAAALLGIESKDRVNPAQEVYEQTMLALEAEHIKFCMGRIRMGALMCIAHDTFGWTGVSTSFNNFLKEHGFEPKAGHQYMDVARKFVLELQISDEQLKKISRASMRTLVEAAKGVHQGNLEEVLKTISTLPREDAIQELGNIFNHRSVHE